MLFGNKFWRVRIMSRVFFVLICGVLLFSGCGEKRPRQDVALEQLTNLYTSGYNVKELSLRLGCSEKEFVSFLQGMAKIDNSLCQPIDSLSQLNGDGDIIPVNKLNKTANECLWHIYTKAKTCL